jgi:Mg-chelatase subunit ChlD
MRLAHPWMLVAALALPWIWWAARRTAAPPGRLRTRLRTISAALLILAAAGTSVRTRQAPLTLVVLADRSASIPLAAQARMQAHLTTLARHRRAGDRVGVVAFGAEAAVESRPSERPTLDGTRVTVGEAASNIAAALRVARTTLPTTGSRRVLLYSDGRDTVGDADGEARRLAASGVPIDVLAAPLDERALPVRVSRLTAPADVPANEPFPVTIEITGLPGARADVMVRRSGVALVQQQMRVGPGGRTRATVQERLATAGTYTYTAAIETDDGGEPLSEAGAAVAVGGPPAVLYVASGTPHLAGVLRQAGYDVDLAAPERVPTSRNGFSRFAAVVLDDVTVDAMPTAAHEALVGYVERDGGGLFVLGGATSLDAAGYPTTTVDRVLPIDLRPRSGRRAPAVDLVLVFDKSGSMGDVSDGLQKIDVARQAVAQAVDVMPRTDAIGILAFDTMPRDVVPLTAGLDQQVVRDALAGVAAGGSTAIAPAVERALTWLESSRPGARRQVLLLSDGRTSDADAMRLRALARSRRAEISVVALGESANRALLEELATASGGRSYFPTELRQLPRAVAREASRASGGGVVEEAFTPSARPHPAFVGIDLAHLPRTGGYAVGAAKPGAEALLTSHLGDPVLAAWQVGVGRVVVFTAGLGSSWTSAWQAWPDGGRFWTQTTRWVSRQGGARAFDAHVIDTNRGPLLQVVAAAADGAPRPLGAVTADVRAPDDTVVSVALAPQAPGRFEAAIPAAHTGAYTLAVTARLADGTEEHATRAVYWSADREHRAVGVDAARLAALAAASGGRVLTPSSNPFEVERPYGWRDISGWCAALALAVFLGELVAGDGRGFPGLHLRTPPADNKAGLHAA